jgi:hypothetical protein
MHVPFLAPILANYLSFGVRLYGRVGGRLCGRPSGRVEKSPVFPYPPMPLPFAASRFADISMRRPRGAGIVLDVARWLALGAASIPSALGSNGSLSTTLTITALGAAI